MHNAKDCSLNIGAIPDSGEVSERSLPLVEMTEQAQCAFKRGV
jgi:hypothetical protein